MSNAYVREYREHLGQLQNHLSGKTRQPLPSSFIRPTGYWTSQEKDYFFHALTLHSRLRPDLIADMVRSKNVLEVCAYIDALEKGAAARPPDDSPLRSALESAMEVSDSWVEYEEEQANALTRLESKWEEEALEDERSALLESRFQDDETYWSWKEEKEAYWAKKDALAQLGIHHLRTLDRIVRDAEGSSYEPVGRMEQLLQPETSAAPATTTIDNGLIDPALLALSSSGPPPRVFQHLAPPEPAVPPTDSSLAAIVSLENPPTSPPGSPQLSLDASVRTLSPASRRRLAKRLHMRKKRAQAKGTAANMTTTKLVPGRKKRERNPKPRPKKYKPRKLKNADGTSGMDMEEDEDTDASDLNVEPPLHLTTPPGSPSSLRRQETFERGEDEEDEDAPADEDFTYRGAGGVTMPYKIKSTLEDRGINANTIAENSFNVFNLPMIGKFMGLCKTAYDDSGDKSIATSISSNTIEVLNTILTDFTTRAVQRAISLREQEVKLKRKKKVWRLDKEDEVTSGIVLDALQMHGYSKHSLLSDFPADSSEAAAVDAEDNNEVASECFEQHFTEDVAVHFARLPLHRELLPPFVSLSSRADDGSLMPDDIDSREWLAVLDQETKLDTLDARLGARYEEGLWQAIKVG
ncbi:hypothetical protein B0H10DRAFT_624019 [Mycena sp. CBHHK59/15]|nr:hypothetical protein B0H10DRAFT_624019 [Mycena sp. CBHHK59/15]